MNHLSLFSGIGGIDLAAEWAGMTTVAFVEQNKFCQKVLAKHWPGIPIFDDVRTVSAKDFDEPIDIVSGGFPCQPYSVAGKQLGGEDDRALWPEYKRIIREADFPTWVVGENVIGLEHLALDDVLADLESQDYECRVFDIPACAVGAFHQRRRFIIVAHYRGERNARYKQEALRRQQTFQGRQDGGRFAPLRAMSDIPGPWLRRSSNGIREQLHALGNAVMPQQIYPVLKAIADVEIAKYQIEPMSVSTVAK